MLHFKTGIFNLLLKQGLQDIGSKHGVSLMGSTSNSIIEFAVQLANLLQTFICTPMIEQFDKLPQKWKDMLQPSERKNESQHCKSASLF